MTARNTLGDRALQAITAVVVAGMACFRSTDGDLGFHLATGRYVLSTGHIPARNVLSFTEPDHVWLLHQWLPATLFELVYRSYGFVGLGVLKMLTCAVLFALVFRTAQTLGATALASTAACILAASACAFRFELRPLLFTHLTLAALLLCTSRVFRAVSAGASLSSQTRTLVLAALIMALGYQLHAGALDGLVACLVLGVGCLLEPLRARVFGVAAQRPFGTRAFLSFAAAGVGGLALAAVALALYHPIGPRILLFPLEMARDAYLSEHLVEFRSPTRFPFDDLATYWLLLVLVTAAWFARMRSLHAAQLLLTATFAVLSLRHVRLVFGFAVVSAPLLALGVDHAVAALTTQRARWMRVFCSTAMAVLLVATPINTLLKLPLGFGTVDATWPHALFAQLDALHVQGQGFVSDAWAGPLLGLSYPRRLAYWDNRFEAYSREFFMREYQDVRYGKPGWDTALDHYGVQWVLLRYTTATEARFQHGAPNLRQRLSQDARWSLVTFDDLGALWVRRHGPNEALAARLGIDAVDPDRGAFTGPPRAALSALTRLVGKTCTSVRALTLAASSAADSGNTALANAWSARAKQLVR